MGNTNMANTNNISHTDHKTNNFIIQAIILAIAGFISRIIGLLYAVPLYQIIGEEGNGYYGTAYEIYNMLLLITAYSMPMAISKIMAVYVAEKDYVNCNRLFHCSMFYVTVVGGIASLLTYFCAEYWVITPAVMALKVMAPTIFISGYLSVFRGYMQAHGTMVPTAISQIIEQIINAVLSIALAYLLMKNAVFPDFYSKVISFFNISATASQDNELQISQAISPASFGAAGSALGTLGGVLIALFFMIGFYIIKRRKVKKTIDTQKHFEKEPYFTLLRVIFLMVSPIIFTTFVYNLSTTIDMKLFWWWAGNNNIATQEASSIFGIYSRQYLVLINLPVSIASAIAASMMPDLATVFRKKNPDIAVDKISKAIRTILLVTIPAAFGLTILAEPIMQLLFNGTSRDAAYALAGGSISVVFFSVSTVLNSALQGMNKSFATVINVIKALFIHIAYVAGMLKVSDNALEILVSGSVLYSFVICAANIKSLEKLVGARINVRDTLLKPVIASIIMGIITILTYNGVLRLGMGNIPTVIISIAVAIIVYFALILRGKPYTDRNIFKPVQMEKTSTNTLLKWMNVVK